MPIRRWRCRWTLDCPHLVGMQWKCPAVDSSNSVSNAEEVKNTTCQINNSYSYCCYAKLIRMPRKLLKFLILFDNTSLLYFPGQFLSGRVLIELQDDTPALGKNIWWDLSRNRYRHIRERVSSEYGIIFYNSDISGV